MRQGEGPVVAAAVHAGCDMRADVRARLALDPRERRREEDPFTDRWAAIAPNRIVMHRSRFEVDVNRPRELAIYRGPEQAWGLHLWRIPPDERFVAESLAIYDGFYAALRSLLEDVERRHGGFVLLDLHTYNFRRAGPEGAPADPASNPDVNVGTDGMPRARWQAVVETFVAELRRHAFRGRALDVRQDVRFTGGNVPNWVHRNFDRGCALAVEVKKFFMEEWTGDPVPGGVEAVQGALATTVPLLGERVRRA